MTDVLERVPGPAVTPRETTAPGFAVIAIVPGWPGPPAAPTSDRNAGTAVWARAVATSEATAALAAASLVGLTARSWPPITHIAICAVDACSCLAGVTAPVGTCVWRIHASARSSAVTAVGRVTSASTVPWLIGMPFCTQ